MNGCPCNLSIANEFLDVLPMFSLLAVNQLFEELASGPIFRTLANSGRSPIFRKLIYFSLVILNEATDVLRA